jgi:UDP:flavonoid glycosyltransferase YjiC (YdhE family)
MPQRLTLFFGVVGSGGDLNPMIAIAAELQRRGHACTVLAGEWQVPAVRRLGLECLPILDTEQFQRFTAHGHAAPERNWLAFFYDAVFPAVAPAFAHVRERLVPGRTALVGASHVIGLRLAAERFGLPLLTTHVQPEPLRPAVDDAFARYFNGLLGRPLAQHRRDAGLAPDDRPFIDWLDDHARTVAFFPPWFPVAGIDAAPVRQGEMLDFLFDDPADAATPPRLDAFMARHDRPLVFTAGTGNASVGAFFAAAADCVERLGRPAIFLSRERAQMPERLPAEVLAIDYLPFQALLPYAGAIVHHGGIGTCAQALRAGIPQLVVPGGFDQFDNARRVLAFGVGDRLDADAFGADAMAAKLAALLADPAVSARCDDYRRRFDPARGAAWCCDRIEAILDDALLGEAFTR